MYNSKVSSKSGKIMNCAGLIPFLLVLLVIGSTISLTVTQSSMERKLHICYQNMGLGLEASKKLVDLLNLINSRHPHILFVSETLLDQEAKIQLEAKGYVTEVLNP